MSARTALICREEGIDLYKRCRYREAESLFVESVRRARDEGASGLDLGDALVNLSVAYFSRAKYLDAKNVLNEALHSVAQASSDQDKLLRARCLQLRAYLHIGAESFEDARSDLRAAIALIEHDNPRYTAELWSTLAWVYKVGLELDEKAEQAVESFLEATRAIAERSKQQSEQQIYYDDVLGLALTGYGWAADASTESLPGVIHQEDHKTAQNEFAIRALMMRAAIRREMSKEAAALTSEALELAEKLENKPHRLAAQVHAYRGELAFGQGDWGHSASYTRQALKVAESFYGENHPALCEYLAKAACFTLMTDGLPSCEVLMTRALRLLDTATGERHPLFARYQLMWSGLLSFVSNQRPDLMQQQESLVIKSIDTLSDVYESNHTILIRATLRLARIYLLTARTKETERLLKESLANSQRLKHHSTELSCECLEQMTELWQRLGNRSAWSDSVNALLILVDDPGFKSRKRKVQVLSHICDQLVSLGDIARAEDALLKAQELAAHIDTMLFQQCQEKLASSYMQSGQTEKGSQLLAESLEGASTQQMLAHKARASWALCSTGQSEESEKLALEVLNQAESELPDSVQAFMLALSVLIELYVGQSRLEDSCRIVGILKTKKEALGVPAQSILPLCLKLVADGYAAKQDRRADSFYEQAIAAAEEIVGIQPEVLDDCIAAYGDFCSASGQTERAQRLYSRLLSLREKTFGQSSQKYALALLALAEIDMKKDMNQAQEKSRRGLEILEAFEQPHVPTLIIGLELRARIMQKLNRLEEVQGLIERIKRLHESLKPEPSETKG